MHQLVEYILGGSIIMAGAQGSTPALPCVVGGLIVVHAASTRGALAAFRVINLPVHRVGDIVLVAMTVAAAVQPAIEVDSNSRLVMLVMAAVQAFVWLNTNFVAKPTARQRRLAGAPARAGGETDAEPLPTDAPAADGGLSTAIGRRAGRLAASGVKAARRARGTGGTP
jgi:hypothetical protein